MKNSVETAVVEFPLVKKIMAILKLDEAGKISKFFSGIVKDNKREIAKIEANIKANELEYETEMDQLDENLEDAKDAVEAAYQAVTLEDVKTNEAMESFKSSYLANIRNKEAIVTRLEAQIKAKKENYDETLKANKEQIAKREALIAKLTK